MLGGANGVEDILGRGEVNSTLGTAPGTGGSLSLVEGDNSEVGGDTLHLTWEGSASYSEGDTSYHV